MRGLKELFRDKRAVNAVISSVILTGAVLTVSFSVLIWTQSQASTYNDQFSDAVNSDINMLKERLSFEYIFYNRAGGALTVFLLNSGTIGNVTLPTVYVKNSTWLVSFSGAQINLKFMNGTSYLISQGLDVKGEGYFSLPSITLVAGKIYSVRVVTGRGSSFENTFVA
jgi:hypothetical protein